MHLAPHDIDKLLIASAGGLAQRRLARGLKLNISESVALLSLVCLEWIRDGQSSVSDLMSAGRAILGRASVLPGVAELVEEVAVEGQFPDGTKLVTMHHPIVAEETDYEAALYGSGLTYKPIAALQGVAAPSSSSLTASSALGADGTAATAVADIAVSPMVVANEMPLSEMLPGQVLFHPALDLIPINGGRNTRDIILTNLDDRPIQVGSHYPLLELNPLMSFDRRLAYGYRLNIPAGTAVRFEPGVSRTVNIVEIGGERVIRGGNHLALAGGTSGGLVDEHRFWGAILQELTARGFAHKEQIGAPGIYPSTCVRSRSEYASMYGITRGDRLRLGDTSLFVEVEWDACEAWGGLGDELKFGGGKVLRDGMGQASGTPAAQALDLLISNVVIIDARLGVIKADVGIKEGRIVGIGKGGNPHLMTLSAPNMIFGVNTDSIDGSGLILTAGAIDSHVHFICPQLLDEALAAGVTTLIGGGVGPTSGTNATTCTPNPHAIRTMLQATDSFPINIGLTGKGNSSHPAGLQEQVDAGCVGLKLHEDWASTPACIDTCLQVAEENDIQVTIHTDTLNESGSCPHTVAAIGNRTIHSYHTEGAGGGHAPDIISVCGNPWVLPSSTNPTRPFTVNTVDEHVDMLMVCHHLDKNLPEDVSFAESRIRGETIAAEDILHDLGAISMMSSDSQAMGRIGELVTRTWQTAHKMKEQRGHLPPDHTDVKPTYERGVQNNTKQSLADGDTVPASSSAAAASTSSSSSSAAPTSSSSPSAVGWSTPHDNFRVRRYLAKYTLNPAVAHGVSHLVGGVGVGLLADLILWTPASFGTRPHTVLKGGVIVYAQMGDANASIPTPQPSFARKMFGAAGAAAARTSLVFVSRSCAEKGNTRDYGIHKRVEPVKKCRGITKKDMFLNSALPLMSVDPQTFRVTADGVHLTCKPATTLPLTNKLYGLF